MVAEESFNLSSRHEEHRFARCWRPDGEVAGAVGIVHGLGEHSGRYAHVARTFASANYMVIAYDQQGHGQSSGQKGHVRSYSDLLHDVGELVDSLAERAPNVPRFLLGQSLGGNLVLNFALRHTPSIDGIIALSPLLLPTRRPPTWKLTVGHTLNVVWPTFAFAIGIDPTHLSRDPTAIACVSQDPMIQDRVSARLAVQMFAAGRWALARASTLRTRTLLMHGTADPVTSCEASGEFAKRAGQYCTFREWPELLHELHWEREREEVLAAILGWTGEATHLNRCS